MDHYAVSRKPFPFSINRNDVRSLLDQVSDGLRSAIVSGSYAPGDEIPSSRELCPLLGVSRIVTSAALTRLVDEGYLLTRKGLRPTVRDRSAKLWRGQVLLVVPPGLGNYRENTVHAALRDSLTAAGYMPLVATVPHSETGALDDFSLLEAMLRQPVELTVCLHDAPQVVSWLSRRKVPFALFGRNAARAKRCLGFVHNRDDLVLDTFVAHCREAGIRSVLQVTAMLNGPNAVPALKSAGIRATNWTIPPPFGGRNAMHLVQRATDEFAARLAKGRAWLPNLLFFRDDHLATGAFVALLDAGVRIPGDVRVATWANKGLGPPFPRPLTRMELDNEAVGERLAACVLEYLRTGTFPQGTTVGPDYVKGETL